MASHTDPTGAMPDTAGAVSDAAPSPPPDVVCVLGQTGAGKTRLAVEIALECGGEVVNCDAMQVYAGLPIATAQASAGEMRGVPHHMLGCVDPFANGGGGASTSGRGAGKTGKEDGGGITVRDFRDAALGIIGEIRARGKTPVLVGGSDYYLRAVVCESLLDDGDDASAAAGSDDAASSDEDADDGPNTDAKDASAKRPRTDTTDAVMDESAALAAHARLREVDPVSAAKIHPRNTRRVRRYLEIYESAGTPPSELFARQRKRNNNRRFRSLFLCMRADTDELDLALRRRVDGMLRAGLVEELEAFAAKVSGGGGTESDARGVAQSIGFHEWGRYLRARGLHWTGGGGSDGHCGDDGEGGGDVNALREEAVEAMKADTCRLARRQLRRCRRLERAFGWRMIYLDSTATHAGLRLGDDVAARGAWARDVRTPALDATVAFLSGEDPGGGGGGEAAPAEEAPWTERRCEACDKTLRGETEWRAHVEGKRHRNRVAALRKKREGKHGTRQRESPT